VVERSDTTGNQIQNLSHPEWVPDKKETWASKEGQVSLITIVGCGGRSKGAKTEFNHKHFVKILLA
jgi:hypothetical protein